MCRHQEDEGHILDSPDGKYNPSVKWLFHYEDTHGLPHEYVGDWLFKGCYYNSDGENLLEKYGNTSHSIVVFD